MFSLLAGDDVEDIQDKRVRPAAARRGIDATSRYA